jgi:acid stress-induced BolA-like protein IbaG/YrbA
MFEIMVETPEFKGLSVVKQHRMINEVKTKYSKSNKILPGYQPRQVVKSR